MSVGELRQKKEGSVVVGGVPGPLEVRVWRMAGRDFQRGGGGVGGVLPNLVTPDGVDIQVMRKRQYLAELQHQAEQDRVRKAGERVGGRGGGGGGGGAQFPSPPRNRNQGVSPQPAAYGAFGGAVPAYAERGNDFAARLKQGFEAALQQAQQQVAGGPERYPDGPLSGGRDQGAEVLNAMRRWESMVCACLSNFHDDRLFLCVFMPIHFAHIKIVC